MKVALRNMSVLDGTKEMMPKTGLRVLVDGETITAIEPDEGTLPEGYTEMDLGGKYLMPGLINAHVHLPSSGKPGMTGDAAKKVKLLTSTALLRRIVKAVCAGSAKTQLLSGCTTIRTVGGVLSVDSEIRDDIEAGKSIGPRILPANMAVSVPGGHMAGSLAYEATSPEDAAFYVETIAKDHPALIKLMITGGVLDAKTKGGAGELKMPAEYVKAACDKAHELGLPVAAHVESTEGVRVALENGVDTIEHGASPDDDIMRLFKERNAKLVATVSPALPFAFFDPAVSGANEMEQYNGKVVFDGIVECAKRCIEEGVPVGLGQDTGCPYVTHYDMWREIYLFRKFVGVSNAYALYTATLGNAKVLGIDNVTGSIEAGKAADFILTEKNPLEDLSVLRNLAGVCARGRFLPKTNVKKMPKIDEELDKFL